MFSYGCIKRISLTKACVSGSLDGNKPMVKFYVGTDKGTYVGMKFHALITELIRVH